MSVIGNYQIEFGDYCLDFFLFILHRTTHSHTVWPKVKKIFFILNKYLSLFFLLCMSFFKMRTVLPINFHSSLKLENYVIVISFYFWEKLDFSSKMFFQINMAAISRCLRLSYVGSQSVFACVTTYVLFIIFSKT